MKLETTSRNIEPPAQNGKSFPPWANWLLALLLFAAMIQLLHERFGTDTAAPATGVISNTTPVALSPTNKIEAPASPAISNPPAPPKFVSRRTRVAGEDDVNTTQFIAEATNWVSMADAGVTGSVTDIYAPAESTTNVQQAAQVTTRERELVTLARKTFAVKNNPSYANDGDLANIANAVASFYLHYPSRIECEHLIDICMRLEHSKRYVDPLRGAIEGSRYILENELAMTDRGFYRYGRTWVDANGLAQIRTFIAERTKKAEADLAKQRQEQSRLSDKAQGAKPAALPPQQPHLKGPNHPIKRIGSD